MAKNKVKEYDLNQYSRLLINFTVKHLGNAVVNEIKGYIGKKLVALEKKIWDRKSEAK